MNHTLTENAAGLRISEHEYGVNVPTPERRNWIEQQRRVIETEMRALWFSTGFTLIGLFVAVALLYINRM